MATLEEIEERRSARKALADKARLEQETRDMEAIDALEVEANESLHTMTANGYKAGVPVKVAFRPPSAVEYKRYCDGISRSEKSPVDRRKVQEQLAHVCWVYPAKDTPDRAAVLEAFPGVLISLAIEVAKVAEMAAESEGKG
jgi:hypothetical protein